MAQPRTTGTTSTRAVVATERWLRTSSIAPLSTAIDTSATTAPGREFRIEVLML